MTTPTIEECIDWLDDNIDGYPKRIRNFAAAADYLQAAKEMAEALEKIRNVHEGLVCDQSSTTQIICDKALAAWRKAGEE